MPASLHARGCPWRMCTAPGCLSWEKTLHHHPAGDACRSSDARTVPLVAEVYDSSDEALFRLVDIDELDALLAAGARPVARDAGKVIHLLTRMRTTLESHRATVTGLHRHVGQMNEHLQRVGQATTLNPMDALRYLDDEQRELLFDRIARDRLSMLRHMVEQAESTREHLVTELEQVRDAAAAMAQRPDLPSDVRADFTRLLAFLPSEVRPVNRPGLLDYPDPKPLPAAVPGGWNQEPAEPAPTQQAPVQPYPLAAPGPVDGPFADSGYAELAHETPVASGDDADVNPFLDAPPPAPRGRSGALPGAGHRVTEPVGDGLRGRPRSNRARG